MLKNAKLALKITQEVKLVVRNELSNRTEEEMDEIYNDEKKLKNFAKSIYPKFSEELRSFMPLDNFQDVMLKQRKKSKNKESITERFKKKFSK